VHGQLEEVREGPEEGVWDSGGKAAYGLVAYHIRADCRAVIQVGNHVVDFGTRYRMEFVAEAGLDRDKVQRRASGWAERQQVGTAYSEKHRICLGSPRHRQLVVSCGDGPGAV
jgi:hypothetical protein